MSSELRICNVGLFIQPLIYLFELIADWVYQFGLQCTAFEVRKRGSLSSERLKAEAPFGGFRVSEQWRQFCIFSLFFSKLDRNLFFLVSKLPSIWQSTQAWAASHITFITIFFILQLSKKFLSDPRDPFGEWTFPVVFSFNPSWWIKLTQSIWFQRAVHVASNISWV